MHRFNSRYFNTLIPSNDLTVLWVTTLLALPATLPNGTETHRQTPRPSRARRPTQSPFMPPTPEQYKPCVLKIS
ncbi:hypothetical protein K461DRAFT_175250 [Myriangium duriaei CBS 260.36]|uniref:Uncharacterized protein n=1 Tax=Myriangium duriaei CBS 260.36 TaxID=1168546 RepID=A0A9P4J0W9_9PEZI|nr:hypothetical protein K461DRAFT_175250 [Myriangium duriaei CBS 260.36]